MLSRGSSSAQNDAPPNSAASSMFRGILGGYGPSVVDLESKIKDLSNEVSVLQDELESKIAENESLVIDCSDMRRQNREVEQKLESFRIELENCVRAKESAIDEMERFKRDKVDLSTRLEGYEIQIDGLRRDSVLQTEQTRKLQSANESIQISLDQEISLRKSCELELRELKTAMMEAESKLTCLSRDLFGSDAEKQRLAAELFSERTKQESLNLRIDALEDELSIASIPRTSPVIGRDDTSSLPACNDQPGACCHRSEYFLSRLKTVEEALRMSTNRRV